MCFYCDDMCGSVLGSVVAGWKAAIKSCSSDTSSAATQSFCDVLLSLDVSLPALMSCTRLVSQVRKYRCQLIYRYLAI
jgi:hypothetical protein